VRILIVLALLPTTARADPTPRLTWVLGAGAGRVDDVSGMAAAWSIEVALVHRRSLVGLELGMGGICPVGHQHCDGTFDVNAGLHARRRLGNLWVGGGIVAHRVERLTQQVAARGQLDATAPEWKPGIDLQLAYELRTKDEPWFGGHFGLRAFVIRDDADLMSKPLSRSPVVVGVDGGVQFEVGYIFGR
jgi:hypothetical protein